MPERSSAPTWLRLVLTMLVVLGTTIALAPGAQAASCYRTTCNNKDPNGQSCNTGLTTPQSKYIYSDARVDLRYSSECDANWGRFVYSGAWNCCVQGTLTAQQQHWNGSAWVAYRTKTKTFTWGATQDNIWTNMNPNETNDRHRACVDGVCTGWNS